MAENLNVNPTPIQRNSADVAIELTKIHQQLIGFKDEEDIGKTYAKFYSLANILKHSNATALKKHLPEELKTNF